MCSKYCLLLGVLILLLKYSYKETKSGSEVHTDIGRDFCKRLLRKIDLWILVAELIAICPVGKWADKNLYIKHYITFEVAVF